jgi:hypothetical protein
MSDAQQRTPEYYAEKARQIWRFALRAQSAEVRLELLDLARRFARMAAHVQHRSNCSQRVGDGLQRTPVSPPPRPCPKPIEMGGHPMKIRDR